MGALNSVDQQKNIWCDSRKEISGYTSKPANGTDNMKCQSHEFSPK